MIKIKKILVPTDLREQSLAGVKYAISLAREHGAEVLVLLDIPHNSATGSGRFRPPVPGDCGRGRSEATLELFSLA